MKMRPTYNATPNDENVYFLSSIYVPQQYFQIIVWEWEDDRAYCRRVRKSSLHAWFF